MSDVLKPEKVTQRRVIELFQDELGYKYWGDWADRPGNSNIEEQHLTNWLGRRGYKPAQIGAALQRLQREASNASRSLYANNQAVYNLLRYGVAVKIEAGKPSETIQLIAWDDPTANEFAIAEEVTLTGGHERRPDLVLYLNGIAVGVLELKNSRVSIGDGIRQSLSNQRPEFNKWFYTTVQFVFAGNDTEGLQYGTIGTPAKYFLKWKEDEESDEGYKLDKYLKKLCDKERLIELMKDFVLFDAGVKKLPRPHQYFGIKAAQERVGRHEGGIIWHTQGSGKSIVMVLLAKWILENNPKARVAVITDRDELDKQIEGVFEGVGEPIKRAQSGRDLLSKLGEASPRLLCSLVHKFAKRDVEDFDAWIKDMEGQPSSTVGEIFVFIDECHRTQSGKLHRAMKAMMPNAKDLFKKVEKAIAVYSSELDDSAPGAEPDVLLQDRLTKGRERLDDALEALELLCEPVEPPKGELDFIHYFCGNTEIPSDLEEREPQRSMLYKAVASFARAYANLADDMDGAGYTPAEIQNIKNRLDHYLAIREIVRNASGETLDLKAYEADMRYLIDTYIEADDARKISAFDDVSLLDLIVKTGIADAIASKLGSMKGNKDAIAETIENNVRSKIIKEHLNDPDFYDRISALLDEIIRNRREKALQYEEYLRQIADLVKRMDVGTAEGTPEQLNTPGKRALYNNLESDEELALRLDDAVKQNAPDGWRGVEPKERVIKKALYQELGDKDEVERIFLIIKAQREY